MHDAGILADDRPFLVMELCPGGSLTRWLTRRPAADQSKVRDVGVRIADALAAAHGRGVLHRDVKPANILIDAYDNPGLADFGLAALPDPGMELSESIEAHHPGVRAAGGVRRAAAHRVRRCLLPRRHPVRPALRTAAACVRGRQTEPPPSRSWLERQHEPIEPIPGVNPAFMELLLAAMADEPTRAADGGAVPGPAGRAGLRSAGRIDVADSAPGGRLVGSGAQLGARGGPSGSSIGGR